jgi:two-component system, sensor histidine kinase PdtaS
MPTNRDLDEILRKKAEARIKETGKELAEMTPEEIMRVVHELQVYQIELEMQNDELVRTQTELEESRIEYVDLFEFAPLGYLTISEKGLVRRANFAATTILGADLVRLLNSPLSLYLADQKSIPVFVSFLKKIFKSQVRQTCIIWMKKGKDGKVAVRLDSSPVIIQKEDMKICTISMSDITRKLVEEELKSLLIEKETILKEVQHRVKNNFQTLFSLINMQENNARNSRVSQEFSAIKSRLISMSLIHERLYKTGQFSTIDLTEYIQSLVNELYNNMVQDPAAVRLKINLKRGIMTSVDSAIHVGMVVNEVITNSLKHAFPPDLEGTGILMVSMLADDDDMITLNIGDNGVGCPEGVSPDETMGLKLIDLLVTKQLKGTVKRTADNGTRYEIQFKNIPEDES